MSKSLYFGIGDELLSGFLEDFLVNRTENVKEFKLNFDNDTIGLRVTGNYMKMSGTAEYDLILSDFTGRVGIDEYINFQIIPRNALSKMLKGAFNFFKKELEPAVYIDKDMLKLNVIEMVKKWKPEVYDSVSPFRINEFKITPGNLIISLEHI